MNNWYIVDVGFWIRCTDIITTSSTCEYIYNPLCKLMVGCSAPAGHQNSKRLNSAVLTATLSS